MFTKAKEQICGWRKGCFPATLEPWPKMCRPCLCSHHVLSGSILPLHTGYYFGSASIQVGKTNWHWLSSCLFFGFFFFLPWAVSLKSSVFLLFPQLIEPCTIVTWFSEPLPFVKKENLRVIFPKALLLSAEQTSTFEGEKNSKLCWISSELLSEEPAAPPLHSTMHDSKDLQCSGQRLCGYWGAVA